MSGMPAGYDEWKTRSPDDDFERRTGRNLGQEEADRENDEALEACETLGMLSIDEAPTDREITIVIKEREDPDDRAYEHIYTRRAYCTEIDIFYRFAFWRASGPNRYGYVGAWGDSDIIGWLPKAGEEPVERPGLHRHVEPILYDDMDF